MTPANVPTNLQRARNYLQAQWLHGCDHEGCIDIGPFHDYLLSIDAPVVQTLEFCKRAGWFSERPAFDPYIGDYVVACYWLCPSVMGDEWPTLRKAKLSREEANERAKQLAREDQEFVKDPDARQWAKKIGCSVGLIPDLPLWQATMKHTGKGRSKGRGKVTAIALTARLESSTGEGDRHEILNRLIAAQEADSEPSPLDDLDDLRAKPIRVRKRL